VFLAFLGDLTFFCGAKLWCKSTFIFNFSALNFVHHKELSFTGKTIMKWKLRYKGKI